MIKMKTVLIIFVLLIFQLGVLNSQVKKSQILGAPKDTSISDKMVRKKPSVPLSTGAGFLISDDPSAVPDPSAILDVKITGTTKKGVLIPRMTASERLSISSPAVGLLVYQTDGTAGFYYWDGSVWQRLSLTGEGGLPSGSAGQTLRHDGTSWVANSTLYNDGTYIGIGTSSVSGYRLTIRGGTNDASAYGLRVENSSGSILMTVRNDGQVYMNGPVSIRTVATGGLPQVVLSDNDGFLSTSGAGTEGQVLTWTASGPAWAIPEMDVASTVWGPIAATAAKSTVGAILISPIYIPARITVNQIRLRVTTALGAPGDVGIYDSNGNLVLNGGAGSLTTTAGVKIIVPQQANRTLNPGQYYVAVTWNSASGAIAGANLGVAGAMFRTGYISTGGGVVLPATINLNAITATPYIYYVSLNR